MVFTCGFCSKDDAAKSPLSTIEVSRQELLVDETKPIGRGTFALVFRGTLNHTDVAVKEFKSSTDAEVRKEMTMT
jgi:hypothetical protein